MKVGAQRTQPKGFVTIQSVFKKAFFFYNIKQNANQRYKNHIQNYLV